MSKKRARSPRELLDDLRVRVEPMEVCERADYVVCARKGTLGDRYFPDNRYGACSLCGAPICYRPHAPTRPPKVCTECFFVLAGTERAPRD